MALYAWLLRADVAVAVVTGAPGAWRGRPRWLLLLVFAAFFLRAAAGAARLQHPGAGHRRAHRRRPGARLVQDPTMTRARSSPRCCWRCSPSCGMLVLLVPTMIWVRLRVPRARAAGRVPLPAAADHPRAGDRGRHHATSTPGSTTSSATRALTLTFVYVVLVLPYAYRAIDAALSVDRRRRRSPRRPGPWAPAGPPSSSGSSCPTSGRASCGARSSRSRWCWASSPSPRCCTTTRCRS